MTAKPHDMDFERRSQLRIGEEPSDEAPQTVIPAASLESDSRLRPIPPTHVQREYDETEMDRRSRNHPQTAAQMRQDIGRTLLTGPDIQEIEQKKDSALRRQIPVGEPSGGPTNERSKLGNLGKIIADEPAEGQGDYKKVPKNRFTKDELSELKEAAERARRQLHSDDSGI